MEHVDADQVQELLEHIWLYIEAETLSYMYGRDQINKNGYLELLNMRDCTYRKTLKIARKIKRDAGETWQLK
jgi:hypothetical protein